MLEGKYENFEVVDIEKKCEMTSNQYNEHGNDLECGKIAKYKILFNKNHEIMHVCDDCIEEIFDNENKSEIREIVEKNVKNFQIGNNTKMIENLIKELEERFL